MTTASFSLRDPNFIDSCYIVASVLFILGIKGLSHPRTARRGNMQAAIGMAIAVVATLLDERIENYGLIAVAFGTINVVGGFLVTDRMLSMFKGKKEIPKETDT